MGLKSFCLSVLPNSHAFLDIGGRYILVQIDHKLGELFHVYDVLGVVAARVDDFGASGHLERLLSFEKKKNIQFFRLNCVNRKKGKWEEEAHMRGLACRQPNPKGPAERGLCRTP
jgi:hypothetical protein